MVAAQLHIESNEVRAILQSVCDPEIPVLSILDLGIVRAVEQDQKKLKIKITPTYSGCPAMDTIATDIVLALQMHKYEPEIELILSPAWTTDWLSQEGRKKLEAYGIAAPLSESLDKNALLDGGKVVACTRCHSTNTKMISQFGSTACKALFQCEDCLEPFDYFKCLK